MTHPTAAYSRLTRNISNGYLSYDNSGSAEVSGTIDVRRNTVGTRMRRSSSRLPFYSDFVRMIERCLYDLLFLWAEGRGESSVELGLLLAHA